MSELESNQRTRPRRRLRLRLMKLFTRRTMMMWSLALVVAFAAAVVAVVHSGSSKASRLRQATPLAQTELSPAVKAAIAKAARQNGADPADVVELGGSGSGSQGHGVLAGTDAAGVTLVSFLTGFGMSDFVAGSRYANSDRPMVVTDSVEGPSTEARIVGIVGVATRAVQRVTVDLANGTTITLDVSRAPGIPYQGFSYVSSNASTFPANVTAYNAGGKLLAEHAVDVKPLCPASNPGCTN
jgi:hypothetical protein